MDRLSPGKKQCAPPFAKPTVVPAPAEDGIFEDTPCAGLPVEGIFEDAPDGDAPGAEETALEVEGEPEDDGEVAEQSGDQASADNEGGRLRSFDRLERCP